MMSAVPKILRLDISGKPVGWTHWQDAICLYTKEKVVWTMGEREFMFHGGISQHTGERSTLSVNSIIAVRGAHQFIAPSKTVPPVSNHELFFRDGHMCMYCGTELPDHLLTRDHVVPIYQGGKNTWSNVVAACRSCNTRKGGCTPEQARMALLAVPYAPNWAEYLVLTNRRILADQMEFLKAQVGKGSRLLQVQ